MNIVPAVKIDVCKSKYEFFLNFSKEIETQLRTATAYKSFHFLSIMEFFGFYISEGVKHHLEIPSWDTLKGNELVDRFKICKTFTWCFGANFVWHRHVFLEDDGFNSKTFTIFNNAGTFKVCNPKSDVLGNKGKHKYVVMDDHLAKEDPFWNLPPNVDVEDILEIHVNAGDAVFFDSSVYHTFESQENNASVFIFTLPTDDVDFIKETWA